MPKADVPKADVPKADVPKACVRSAWVCGSRRACSFGSAGSMEASTAQRHSTYLSGATSKTGLPLKVFPQAAHDKRVQLPAALEQLDGIGEDGATVLPPLLGVTDL